MIQVILGLIFLAIAIALIGKILKALLYVIGAAGALACGAQVGCAYLLERLGQKLNCRQQFLWVLTLSFSAALTYWLFFEGHTEYELYSFSGAKFIVSAALFFIVSWLTLKLYSVRKEFYLSKIFNEKEKYGYVTIFSSFAFLMTSAYIYYPFYYTNYQFEYVGYVDLFFWVVATLCQVYVALLVAELSKMAKRFGEEMTRLTYIRYDQLVEVVAHDINIIERNEVDNLIEAGLADRVLLGQVKEVDLSENSWIFNPQMYSDAYFNLKRLTSVKARLEENVMEKLVSREFPFSEDEAGYFVEKYVEYGKYYNFLEGSYFCSFVNQSKYRTCACCGISEIYPNDELEWFCSDLCRETEEICYEIKKKPYDQFIAESSISGFVLVQGGNAWDISHRRISPKGNATAHGNAAEQANNMVDRIKGNDAQVLGGDNSKNGADRIVNGELRQTKYCRTAQRSVGEAFKGDEGGYRYIAPDGKPMALEVPKDQYDQALKAMKEKIADGKVPGVTNPEEAKNLVRAGRITYDQARNITKFGTFESITYDAAEGAILSLSAAGISFGVTATIHYLNTKDKREALRAAAMQGGKTFGTTLIVYVGTQQLHRVRPVVDFLEVIDVSHLPKSVKNILGDGYGVASKSGINKALRGSVVTSAVIITVSSGPDFLRMVRGRMSGAQFVQNISVVSSGVVGGTIGSIAGGALCSPLGPAGMVAGRVAGSVVGGTISSYVATTIAGRLREDDRTQMMKIVKIQFEYLAQTFMLSKEEIEAVNVNLEKVINQETLEKMYAAKNDRHAFATFCLKPVFVGVIRQRTVVHYDESEVVECLEEIAA